MVGSLLSTLPDEDLIPCSRGDIPCITGITQLPIFTIEAFTPEEPSFGRLAGLDPILEVGLNLLLGLRMVTPGLGFPEFNVTLLEAVGKGAWWRVVGVAVVPVEVERRVCVT